MSLVMPGALLKQLHRITWTQEEERAQDPGNQERNFVSVNFRETVTIDLFTPGSRVVCIVRAPNPTL